ncbi:hypothetical protein GQR58_002063 [Nymphon striatum]|nr:hypothetical protein GQR58_002063 [Nymphon striatum]
MPAQKIATCCYCGTRAALVLRGAERHELSCVSCGAPLHDLKMLPKRVSRGTARAATPTHPKPKAVHPNQPHPKPQKIKKRNKRKGIWRKIVEEVWDEIEDIFD